MKPSTLGHLQINIAPQNLAFYKELFGFVGWKSLYEDENMYGAGDSRGSSVWFGGPAKPAANDYDGPGMNHLGISVQEQSDVDEMVAYLQEHGIAALFETPRHRPEFSAGPEQTYYQVMFESPDRILFEVVYMGVKV